MTSPFNWSALAFILAAIALVVFMLVVPRLLGGRSQGAEKEEVFESGVVPAGSARIRLSAKFYLVAIFFVIFDLEALYLYAYSVSVRDVGWVGYATVVIFVIDLLIGLIYALSIGALDWSPADKRRREKHRKTVPANAEGVSLGGGVNLTGVNLAGITKFNGIDELHTDPTGKVPAQSSGQMNTSNNLQRNNIQKSKEQLKNIDRINTTGTVTLIDFSKRQLEQTNKVNSSSLPTNLS